MFSLRESRGCWVKIFSTPVVGVGGFTVGVLELRVRRSVLRLSLQVVGRVCSGVGADCVLFPLFLGRNQKTAGFHRTTSQRFPTKSWGRKMVASFS